MPPLTLQFVTPSFDTILERPVIAFPVSAGFPSPADDYMVSRIDLNQHLIRHPAATFFVRVSGDSMTGAGIQNGDLLIVDRAAECVSGSIDVARVHDEFTLKRVRKEGDRVYLVPENHLYPTIEITEGSDFEIWGCVTDYIRYYCFMRLPYYVKLLSFSVVGLGILTVLGWMHRGFVIPSGVYMFKSVMPFPVARFLSIPVAFALLVHALTRESKFMPYSSFYICLISSFCFIGASLLDMGRYWHEVTYLTCFGTLSSLFIYVPWREFFMRAFHEWQLVLIALAASSISYFYITFDFYLFHLLCQSTAEFIYWVMYGLGFDIGVDLHYKNNIMLLSKYYRLSVQRSCSGIEGMFLLQFLLSSIILLDWPIFKGSNLIEIYLIGFLYMFAVNCLRVASIFGLGYFAWKPDASPLMKSMRQAPLEILHSYIGEIYYFIAFAVFAMVLYKFRLKNKSTLSHPRTSLINA